MYRTQRRFFAEHHAFEADGPDNLGAAQRLIGVRHDFLVL
jgi:hypothetical protein